MAESMMTLFPMVLVAIVLVFVTAIGTVLIERLIADYKKHKKVILKPEQGAGIYPLHDMTPVHVFVHGQFDWTAMDWLVVCENYLSSLPPLMIHGIANALKTEGSWSGNVGDLLIALRIGKGKS